MLHERWQFEKCRCRLQARFVDDQTTARQLDGMTFAQVFEDKVTGSTTDRPALQKMLRYVREGDTVHVHSIDWLALAWLICWDS
jgi:DNA invertase Pin-like site-specific DNA recombinase